MLPTEVERKRLIFFLCLSYFRDPSVGLRFEDKALLNCICFAALCFDILIFQLLCRKLPYNNIYELPHYVIKKKFSQPPQTSYPSRGNGKTTPRHAAEELQTKAIRDSSQAVQKRYKAQLLICPKTLHQYMPLVGGLTGGNKWMLRIINIFPPKNSGKVVIFIEKLFHMYIMCENTCIIRSGIVFFDTDCVPERCRTDRIDLVRLIGTTRFCLTQIGCPCMRYTRARTHTHTLSHTFQFHGSDR